MRALASLRPGAHCRAWRMPTTSQNICHDPSAFPKLISGYTYSCCAVPPGAAKARRSRAGTSSQRRPGITNYVWCPNGVTGTFGCDMASDRHWASRRWFGTFLAARRSGTSSIRTREDTLLSPRRAAVVRTSWHGPRSHDPRKSPRQSWTRARSRWMGRSGGNHELIDQTCWVRPLRSSPCKLPAVTREIPIARGCSRRPATLVK
jgi:hypothetical protein